MEWLQTLLNNFAEAFRWWFMLQPWEQGLRVRMGKRIKKFEGGIHFKFPYVDKLFIQNTRTRITDLASQTITTKDGKTVTLSGAIQYRVVDIRPLYNRLHMAENTVAQMVQGAIAETVSIASVAELSPKKLRRGVYAACFTRLMELGLGDIHIIITDFAVVKTLRLITGEMYRYNEHALQTDAPEEGV